MKFLRKIYNGIINFIKYFISNAKFIVFNLYSRMSIALSIRGINLPGLKRVKKRLSHSSLRLFEREKLVYQIKGEKYLLRFGPLWMRKAFDIIVNFTQKNKFIISIFNKIILAIVVIAIPVFVFILLRATLPVPERVPYEQITKKLNPKSNLKVEYPFTEGPFLNLNKTNILKIKTDFNSDESSRTAFNNLKIVHSAPVLEPNAPDGLSYFSFGYYPTKLNYVRGFLVPSDQEIQVLNQKNDKILKLNEAKLKVKIYLVPNENNEENLCYLNAFDENGKKLFNFKGYTPEVESVSKYSIKNSWRKLFTPNIIPFYGNTETLSIEIEKIPEKIIFKSSIPEFDYGKSSKCSFIISDLSVEHQVQEPLKRRGVLFILVDTLRADTAYDKKLMPKLNKFAQDGNIKFLEHRAHGNMTVPSVASLVTSRYAKEIGPVAFSYGIDEKSRKEFYAKNFPLLPTEFQKQGYRVGAIGSLSLFTEAQEGAVDLGFHNAIVSEMSEYDGRHITELAGQWLQEYGQTPFFLYLHYNTMHGPYKPPVEKINGKELLRKPIALNLKRVLYNGVAQYLDDELESIINKIKDLGIYEDTDIFITADHGAQLYEQPWGFLTEVRRNISGGYADKGHSLLDEELKVPLIAKISGVNFGFDANVNGPTVHADLMPSLLSMSGNTEFSKDNLTRGIDFSKDILNPNILNLNRRAYGRDAIYFDAHKYSGILFWDKNNFNFGYKYIRQFSRDDVRLYLNRSPWTERLNWFQPEIFTKVNFLKHTEKWVPNFEPEILGNARSKYFEYSPSDIYLMIKPKYNGPLDLTLVLNSKVLLDERNDLKVPDGLQMVQKFENNNLYIRIHGTVNKTDEVSINIRKSKILEVNSNTQNTLIACSNGINFSDVMLVHTLNSNSCSFFATPETVFSYNYNLEKEKPILFQKSLSGEKTFEVQGAGAGEALEQALREWGYAK